MKGFAKIPRKKNSTYWDCPKCGEMKQKPPIEEVVTQNGRKFLLKSCPYCFTTVEMESIERG